MIVAHDPGHHRPGSELGTVHNGIVERDFVMRLAVDVIAGLPGWGLRHVLLREPDDELSTYASRAREAREAGAQLVLCHHVNALATGKASGLIAFHLPEDELAREVAAVIARAAPARLYRERRAVIATSATESWDNNAEAVLRTYSRLGLPTVLIEWGFATDPGDAAALQSPAVRPAMVACVGAGLARALELTHPDMA